MTKAVRTTKAVHTADVVTSVEICLDDVGGALVAERAGAARVELCSALALGGLTPSLGFVQNELSAARVLEVQVLIRPRSGDFVVTPGDLEVMTADIAAFSALTRPIGVVLGFTLGPLTPAGAIDEQALAALVSAAGGAPVTFHKAFDAIHDQHGGIEVLARHGVARVLTSGGCSDALSGAHRLAELVAAARGRVAVMAGGSIRAHDVAQVVARSGVHDVHLRAPLDVPSASETGPSDYDTGHRTVTSAAVVAEVLAALERARP